MSKLRFNISMSLDGFVAGPDQSEQDPLGKRGEELHEWVLPLAAFREPHGQEGGEVNASTPVVEGWWENVGALVMGRNMFGGGPGPWGEPPWQGWWGDDPPFHRPGVRAHAPRPRSAGAQGRHHVPLRHRRHRVRARAGQGRCRRQGRVARGWRERCPAVPGGRADRRDGDRDRSRLAGWRHQAVREPRRRRARAQTRFRRSRRPESCTSSTTSQARRLLRWPVPGARLRARS